MLSGNLFFVSFRLIEIFQRGVFSQRNRYRLLKGALLFHLIPLVYLKIILQIWMPSLFQPGKKQGFFIGLDDPAIIVAPGEIHVNTPLRVEWIIYCIGFFVSVCMTLFLIVRRKQLEKHILSVGKDIDDDRIQAIIEYYKKKLGIRRKISFVRIENSTISFTMGILHPIVVVPALEKYSDIEKVIHHELCHIKQNDGLTILIQSVVVGIFWFNPLVWMLAAELEQACEMACDEIVTDGMEREEKKSYAKLIIDMATDEKKDKIQVLSFSKDKEYLKERIDGIMKRKNGKRGVAFLLSIGMMLCGALPVWAYEEPQVVVWESEPWDDLTEGEFAFRFEGEEFGWDVEVGTICYDYQFVDEDGNIYEIDSKNGRAGCDHDYQNGITQKHTKKSDGSCRVDTYESLRCAKCGHVLKKTLQSTTKYTVCPH